MKISLGSVHRIFREVLQYQKVFVRWVPKQHIPDLRKCYDVVCETLLQSSGAEEDDFL